MNKFTGGEAKGKSTQRPGMFAHGNPEEFFYNVLQARVWWQVDVPYSLDPLHGRGSEMTNVTLKLGLSQKHKESY